MLEFVGFNGLAGYLEMEIWCYSSAIILSKGVEQQSGLHKRVKTYLKIGFILQ